MPKSGTLGPKFVVFRPPGGKGGADRLRNRGRLIVGTSLAALAAGAAVAEDDLIVTERRDVRPHAAERISAWQPREEVREEGRPAQTVIAQLEPAPLRPGAPLSNDAGADAEDDLVLFEADSVSRQDDDSPIIAEGNVRAFFGARFLRADRLVYDPSTDIVVAEGAVSITDENLDTAFAGRVELTGDLRDGIAENFSALLEENVRLAADTAVREQGARTHLSNAVYTACDVCTAEGDGKTPTWRVKALRVTRDQERRVVRFRHAFFEIKGVPIFYAPFIQAPDPSVERQSGFLTPVIGASSRLGFNLELPYYLAISSHQDATFYPKYTSNDGVLWQGEYRRRDVSGAHVVQAGVIDFDNTTPVEDDDELTDVPGVRWHFFARGHRDFGDDWTVGYDLERVSDDTYLRRYDIRRRGDLRQEIDTSRTNRLRSNAYVAFRNGGTSATANAYLFQGLRSTDVSSLTPYVLPLINVRHQFADQIAGGRAHLNANFAALQRSGGVDTQRLTLSGFWEREHITEGGHRLSAFAELRTDGYFFHDLDEGTELLAGVPGENRRVEARFAPTVGLEWSYPLTRRIPGGRLFVEPRVQLLASPTNRNSSAIINEDSQSIEFDYAGLFEYNKATGFDRFEDGQRMNAGVAASAEFDNGVSVEISVGQQFRLQETEAFNDPSGLGSVRSDLVGALNVNYKNWVGVENRFRFDDDSGALERAESMAFLNFWRINTNVSYVRLNADADISFDRREELHGEMRIKLTRHWSTGLGWRENLNEGRTIRQDFVIGYSDECTSLNLIYRRDATRDVGLPPDNAFLVQFTLKSLVD